MDAIQESQELHCVSAVAGIAAKRQIDSVSTKSMPKVLEYVIAAQAQLHNLIPWVISNTSGSDSEV
jgi:hypothetical protein